MREFEGNIARGSLATDEVKILRGVLTVFLIGTSAVLAWLGFSINLPAIGLLIPAVAVVSALVGRPTAIFITLLAAINAKFKLPGLPNSLSISLLFLMLMSGWAFLDSALRSQKRRFSYERQDVWVAVFAVNLLLLMAVRGAGMAVLGGMTYGGTDYIALLVACAAYYAVVRIRLLDHDVKYLLIFSVIGALLPMAQEILVYFAGESFLWLTNFFTNQNYSIESKLTGEGFSRWTTFTTVASSLVPLAFVLVRKNWLRLILILLAFVLVGLSGFRGAMVATGIMVFILSMYYAKDRKKVFIFWLAAAAAGLIVLTATVQHMPKSIQRAVSFIPFLEVDRAVVETADESSDFRFDMWRDYCIPNVSKYLLIGRGLAQDVSGFAWLRGDWYGSGEFYYHMGRYHSGPFDLLLTYGLLGTVSFTALFLLVVIDGWKTVRRYAAHRNTLAARYYIFLTVRLTYALVSFYLVFGDVREQWLGLILMIAQMRILKKNFLMESPLAGGVQTPDSLVETGKALVSASGGSAFGGTPEKPVNRWARPGTAR